MPNQSVEFNEIIQKVEKNSKEIEILKNKDWYSNKEIFEKFTEKFESVSKKMDKTNKSMMHVTRSIDKYNGLIEERKEDRKLIKENQAEIKKMQNKDSGKNEFKDNVVKYTGWLLAIITIANYLL